MKFSQNNEEIAIHNYFGNHKGTFLDIGAHDGKALSNTWALSQNGWSGVCIEPSPEIFERLKKNYFDNSLVKCFEIGIGKETKKATFYNNPEYYSTTSIYDMDKWAAAGQKFTQTEIQMYDFKTFLEISPITHFDFISLDAEGLDWEILQQMDLKELQCKMICVEWNGFNFDRFNNYITNFGLHLAHQNNENLIYKK